MDIIIRIHATTWPNVFILASTFIYHSLFLEDNNLEISIFKIMKSLSLEKTIFLNQRDHH